MVVATRTDLAEGYRVIDRVDQLRLWGRSIVYRLPTTQTSGLSCVVGSGDDTLIKLQDIKGRISRYHAELSTDTLGWRLTDLKSKNGVFLDGERLSEFAVTPGAEIRIGRVTLIAESPLLRELQELLRRFIGWDESHRIDIDVALRGIRNATLRREPLMLHAEAGHVSIARLLHAHVVGADRPFVVFDPRGSSAGSHRRNAARVDFDTGMAALAAANGGTLVVRRSRAPADFERMLTALRDGEAGALLIVAAPVLPRGIPLHLQIAVPPLAARPHELDRIIDAYASDALAEMGGSFTSEDLQWVARQPKLTLAVIETATRRALARRLSNGAVREIAQRIGRTRGATTSWFERRSKLTDSIDVVEDGLEEEENDDDDDDD